MARQLAPHLQGASETWQVNYCIDWPIPAANPPRLLNVRGVPTLMVHATHDSSDPYRWAHTLGAQIQGSDLLTRIGDGHTSFYTSPCARTAIDNSLVNPRSPRGQRLQRLTAHGIARSHITPRQRTRPCRTTQTSIRALPPDEG